MAIVFAGDAGHTFYKALAAFPNEKQPRRVFFETILGEVQPLLSPSNGYLQLQTNEGEWFVGQAALEQSKNQIWGQSSNFAFQPEYRALHLLAISEAVSPNTKDIDVYLVSGLPRSDWSNREKIRLSLLGKHEIDRPNRDRKLVINILDVYFIIQGVAALSARNRPVEDDMKIAYLGLGGRNKVYATMKGRKLIADQCGSQETGLLSAIDHFIKEVKESTGRQLKPHEAIEAIGRGKVRAGSRTYEVDSGKVLQPYIQGTHSLIASVWDMKEVNEFRLGGGGVLLPAIAQNLQGQYEQAVLVDDPQWEEVRGLLLMGQAKFR